MFPYWLLFAVFAVGSIQSNQRQTSVQRAGPLLVLAGLFVAAMVGLRLEVGGDWGNYLRIYQTISYLDFGQVLAFSDPGYALLNWIANKLNVGIWFVNLICAAVFAWGLVSFARQQPNPWLAVLIAVPYLIIVVGMGYTRQAVAIGFILAGLAHSDRNSLARFTIYVVLAAAFHKSAVVVLPLVALAATRQRFVTAGILFLTAILLYYLFVEASIDRMMVNYIEAEYESQGAAIRVAMNLPPALVFLLFQRRFGLSEQARKLLRNFSLASLVSMLMLLLTASSTAVDRISLYLIPLQIVILSRLPAAFPDRARANGQLMLLVIAYSAAVQFVWLNFADHAYAWVPYRFYPISEATQGRF